MQNIPKPGTTVRYLDTEMQLTRVRATPLNYRDQRRVNENRTVQGHQVPDRQHLEEPKTQGGIKSTKPYLRKSE